MQNSKKERLTEFNRQNILNTAKRLFQEKGINQTTMDDIAREAQYSKSTIYVYFKSKEEIYNYIVFEYMTLLKQGISEAIGKSESFKNCYYAVCDNLVEFYEMYPLYFDCLLGEIIMVKDNLNESEILRKIYVVGEEINDTIYSFLEDAILKNEIHSDIKPLETAFTLWSSICGIISIANKKEEYVQMRMKIEKQSFMRYGFETLLRSILINEGDYS